MTLKCLRCKSELDPAYRACPHCGEPITEFLRQYSNAPIDGKYRILERLGTGGMGEVYKVEHTFLGAVRVIKVIRPQISDSQDAHDRFLREARVATKVQHPNVATLHDFSALPDGSHYMVWEFIEGENIAQRLRLHGTLPPKQAVELTIEALHGLDAIHRAGIVHRDISPENLMITRDGHGAERVKIIDLGVAKIEDSAEGGTRAGIFVGKLRYASPEQIGFLEEGEKIDGRADLYSMALVLYEMLAGRPPYEATSPHEYVLLHSRETAIRPLNLDSMPGGIELRQVVERALARDRNRRFQNAREFIAALEQVHRSLPDAPPAPAGRFDGDATMRVTPAPGQLPQQTQRSGTLAVMPAAETLRTPIPQAVPPPPPPPAAATLLTPLPGAAPAAAPSGTNRALLVAAILFALVALVAIAALVFLRRSPEPARVAATSTTPTQPPAATQPPSGSVDVVSPTATDTTATIVTTTAETPTATAAPTATVAQTQTHAPEQHVATTTPAPPPQQIEETRPVSNVGTYIDGDSGDSDENERLLAAAQRELSGVTRVAVRGGNAPQLAAVLRRELGDLTIADDADVVIDFTGNLERLGRGRKRRSGEATITKHGRAVFRYQMPAEEYRVGDAPAEAFARIVAEAFGR